MWRFLTELVTYFRLKRKKLEVEKLALENSALSRRLEELKRNSEPNKEISWPYKKR